MNQLTIANPPETVCVVIPTLGRMSLRDAVDSAIGQTRRPSQIVIVNDSPKPLGLGLDELGMDIRIVEGERRGASAARNRGVQAAASDWIAFLDDDDTWRTSKLETQLMGHSSKEDILLACGARVHIGGSLRHRPRNWFPTDLGVLSAFYGTRRFRSSGYYLPTPSFVVPTRVARRVTFDETLSSREDIWWLHQLQAAGIRIIQIPDYLVDVHASVQRNSRHNSEEAQLHWAMKLKSWNSELAVHYLRGVAARDALIAAKPMRAMRLLKVAETLAKSHSRA